MSEYLQQINLDKVEKGNGVRALIRIRCGNMKEENKYWLGEDVRICIFCEKGKDILRYYIENCKITKNWYRIRRQGRWKIK